MTNEQLVALVQAGDRAALVELWGQVRRLVLKYARRWAGLGGTALEDLEQAGAVAMLRAVDGFDVSTGYAFTSYLVPLMKAEFSVATAQTTSRTRRDPLQTASSLDMPLAGEGDDAFTLADLLPDPAAEAAIQEVAEMDWEDHRRAAVQAAIDTLPDDLKAEIVSRYWHDKPMDHLAHAKAMRMLRHPSRSRALMAYW